MYYKKKCYKFIYLGIHLFCFCLGYGVLFGQNKSDAIVPINERISIGAFLNHSLLRGDAYGLSSIGVNSREDVSDAFDFGVGLSSIYQLNSYIHLGLEFNYGNISGTKQWETNTPKSVWTVDGQYINIGFTGRYNLSKIIHKKSPIKFRYCTDLFFGYSKSWGNVLNITEYNNNRSMYTMPLSPLFGLGLAVGYPINNLVSLDLGTKLLFSTSDNFDGINEDIIYNAYNDALWVTRLGVLVQLSALSKPSKERKKSQLFNQIEETSLLRDTSFIYVYDTVKVERDRITPLYQKSLFFDIDKYALTLAHRYELQNVLKILNHYPNSTILITGFTDPTGREKTNITLSSNRVQSVYDWLEYRNVSALRVATNYHGESYLPYDSYPDNRRVNIVILPYETDEFKAKSDRK